MSREFYSNDFVIKGSLEVMNMLLSGGVDLYDLLKADTEVRALTSNWDSAYSTIQTNSATAWNYQGTDVKALTSDWESTYTTFAANSSSFVQTDVSNTTPGLSSITKIVAVSAIPLLQEVGTMYVLI